MGTERIFLLQKARESLYDLVELLREVTGSKIGLDLSRFHVKIDNMIKELMESDAEKIIREWD